MSVVISMDADDFQRLLKISSTRPAMTIEPGRFQTANGGPMDANWDWSAIYWLGHDYTGMILARAFLASRGYLYKEGWDTAGEESGGRGWCIFTDYNQHRQPTSRASRTASR